MDGLFLKVFCHLPENPGKDIKYDETKWWKSRSRDPKQLISILRTWTFSQRSSLED